MRRDGADLVSGLALAVIGLAVAVYAGLNWDIGSPRRMGPGFFPLGLGALLTVLGLAIAAGGWRREAPAQRLALPEMAAVLGAISFFALAMNRAGLVAATATAVLIASTAAPRRGMVWRLVLAVIVTALSVVIFHGLLNMTIPLWPALP